MLAALTPGLVASVEVARAHETATIGEGLEAAAPGLLLSWLGWVATPMLFMVTLALAFLAMRRGERLAARASLLVLLGATVAALMTLQRETAGQPDRPREPRPDSRCVEAALAGTPCPPSAEPVHLKPYRP